MYKRRKSVVSSFFYSKLKVFSAVLVCCLCFSLYAQNYTSDHERGYEAFRKNDWTSSIFFFRKALSSPLGFNEETLYLLVMSEINAGEYADCLNDCTVFLEKFNSSRYAPYIQFYKGKSLHFLGRNEDAVLVLSDFCHQNQDSELYASALYWIAECFYAEYNFDSSRALYERIIYDFPSDFKASDARYRLEMIAQREREEKLLYLLKVTGEENLATREYYERQLKLFKTEDTMGLKKSLSEAQSRILSLEAELSSQNEENLRLTEENENLLLLKDTLQKENREWASKSVEKVEPNKPKTTTKVEPKKETVVAERPLSVYTPSYPSVISDPEVDALKKKASYLQYLLDEQNSTQR